MIFQAPCRVLNFPLNLIGFKMNTNLGQSTNVFFKVFFVFVFFLLLSLHALYGLCILWLQLSCNAVKF